MERIPFGVKQLDAIINGGAPAGSVVLLSGEAGAGSREFMHTSAIINGLAETDEEQFDLYYGSPSNNAVVPENVHYISFTAGEAQLADEMRLAMDDDILDAGLEGVEFHDLSERYFHMSPVPREWYADRTPAITDLRARHERDDLLGALGTTLSRPVERGRSRDDGVLVGFGRVDPCPNTRRQAVPRRPLTDRGRGYRPVRDGAGRGRLRHQRRAQDSITSRQITFAG